MYSINAPLRRNSRLPGQRPTHALHRWVGSGYDDAPPLTVKGLDGEHPRGRELSIAWLAGTVMTGVTSVLLMGAALYVSFQGQENFSTASEAMLISREPVRISDSVIAKGDRLRPVARTRSDLEVLEASILAEVDDRTMIKSQQFTRLNATLATTATPLAEGIPAFDPAALIAAENVGTIAMAPATEIYSANVDGEVAVRSIPLPATFTPPVIIDDAQAADFAKLALQDVFAEDPTDIALDDTGALPPRDELTLTTGGIGIAENLTVLAKSPSPQDGSGRSERIVTLRGSASLAEMLLKNGFTQRTFEMVEVAIKNILPSLTLPEGTKLRILMGPSRTSTIPIPYRLSIYFNDTKTGTINHAATVALTDRGNYVVGLAPSVITFPEEDTEAVDITALPTIYRAIWETARRHDIDDRVTSQIVALFAYELDLAQKVTPGDSIQLLTTNPTGKQTDLIYASLTIGSTKRELFRFRDEDGTVDFYSPDGETGKRFLTRRPLQGGGRLASRYGYRIHPIFKTRRLHAGVDLASPLGTPVYAGGDGVVKRAQWVSGYGRFVELEHVNGYQTAYAHMSRIADGLKPGDRVKQGQLVGYVGSTGNSTGNHLHYEIRINGRTVDPLSVKLPRDKELPSRSRAAFLEATGQIRDLTQRDPQEHAKG